MSILERVHRHAVQSWNRICFSDLLCASKEKDHCGFNSAQVYWLVLSVKQSICESHCRAFTLSKKSLLIHTVHKKTVKCNADNVSSLLTHSRKPLNKKLIIAAACIGLHYVSSLVRNHQNQLTFLVPLPAFGLTSSSKCLHLSTHENIYMHHAV